MDSLIRWSVLLAILFFFWNSAFADTKMQACGKKIVAIHKGNIAGLGAEEGSGGAVKFIIKDTKIPKATEDFFEEAKECLVDIGVTEFYVYYAPKKKLSSCHLFWMPQSRTKKWRCGPVG